MDDYIPEREYHAFKIAEGAIEIGESELVGLDCVIGVNYSNYADNAAETECCIVFHNG